MPPRKRATTPPVPLGERGRAVWNEVGALVDLDPAGRLLLVEACRIADRLESLDALLRGDVSTWAVITDDYAGGKRTTKVVLDDALGEARQQAMALRSLLAQLKLGAAVERPTEQVSALDQLAAQRQRRRTAGESAPADRVGP